MILEPSS